MLADRADNSSARQPSPRQKRIGPEPRSEIDRTFGQYTFCERYVTWIVQLDWDSILAEGFDSGSLNGTECTCDFRGCCEMSCGQYPRMPARGPHSRPAFEKISCCQVHSLTHMGERTRPTELTEQVRIFKPVSAIQFNLARIQVQ